MNDSQFDRIARSFATRRETRRAMLAAVGIGTASMLGHADRTAAEAQATPVPNGSLETPLFVQIFRSGALTPKSDASDEFTLELNGGNGYTVYFSDRPQRLFGAAPTAQFLNGLGFGTGDPPNAALVMAADDEDDAIIVLELMTPVLDEADQRLTYDVKVLGEFPEKWGALRSQPTMLDATPVEFEGANLFIDSCADESIACCKMDCDNNDVCSCVETYGTFGPMSFCWNVGGFCCHPCESNDQEYWIAKCDEQFPDCQGTCQVDFGDCW